MLLSCFEALMPVFIEFLTCSWGAVLGLSGQRCQVGVLSTGIPAASMVFPSQEGQFSCHGMVDLECWEEFFGSHTWHGLAARQLWHSDFYAMTSVQSLSSVSSFRPWGGGTLHWGSCQSWWLRAPSFFLGLVPVPVPVPAVLAQEAAVCAASLNFLCLMVQLPAAMCCHSPHCWLQLYHLRVTAVLHEAQGWRPTCKHGTFWNAQTKPWIFLLLLWISFQESPSRFANFGSQSRLDKHICKERMFDFLFQRAWDSKAHFNLWQASYESDLCLLSCFNSHLIMPLIIAVCKKMIETHLPALSLNRNEVEWLVRSSFKSQGIKSIEFNLLSFWYWSFSLPQCVVEDRQKTSRPHCHHFCWHQHDFFPCVWEGSAYSACSTSQYFILGIPNQGNLCTKFLLREASSPIWIGFLH